MQDVDSAPVHASRYVGDKIIGSGAEGGASRIQLLNA